MYAKHVQQDSTQTNKAARFAWRAVPVHTTTTAMPATAKRAPWVGTKTEKNPGVANNVQHFQN